MKILVVSALFPPDVADPAPYIKELAGRLKAAGHAVTVLTYGTIPEAVENVSIIAVSKQLAAPARLLNFTRQLLKLGRQHDVILINNAPSTGLPLILTSPLLKYKSYLLISDTKINYTGWRKALNTVEQKNVHKIITIDLPEPRPEHHPFHPPSDQALAHYESSWKKHLQTLTATFSL
ncbi:MAG: hypothetical protein KBC35_01900 [Candidatus Pacebacteria bacterium]|nr:hypothetical protein [Candidatus Paceibacterota bacterium]